MMSSTHPSPNKMGQVAVSSTLALPLLPSTKSGSHSTTGTPSMTYKTSLTSLKLPMPLQNLSKSMSTRVPEHLVSGKKPNGGSRFVTSFGEVAKYSKPQPPLMPNVDGVLCEIGKWKNDNNPVILPTKHSWHCSRTFSNGYWASRL